jgi:hypothetical protein
MVWVNLEIKWIWRQSVVYWWKLFRLRKRKGFLITMVWYCKEGLTIAKGGNQNPKKNRQHNGQKKKDKRTNNDQQHIHFIRRKFNLFQHKSHHSQVRFFWWQIFFFNFICLVRSHYNVLFDRFIITIHVFILYSFILNLYIRTRVWRYQRG